MKLSRLFLVLAVLTGLVLLSDLSAPWFFGSSLIPGWHIAVWSPWQSLSIGGEFFFALLLLVLWRIWKRKEAYESVSE